MGSRTAVRFGRATRVAPIAIWLFAGCTCAGNPVGTPIPSATAAPPRTPTVAPTQAAAPAPAPEGQAAAVATSVVAAVDAGKKPTECEGFIAVLSGRKLDPALLDNADLKAFAMTAPPDLIVCGAVRNDSDELCTRFFATERGPSKMCPQMRAIFHEVKTYPQGRSFLLSEVDWEDFKLLREQNPAALDGLRAALRAGDANTCAQAGDLESICRAYIGLDPKLCRLQGKLAEMEVPVPYRKEGEPATIKAKDILEEHCRQTIESRKFLAQGLTALAQSSPSRERELAKAALGQADACALYAQKAMESCMGGAPPPAAGNASPTASVPAAAAPGQPASP